LHTSPLAHTRHQHPYSLLKLGMCGVTLPPLQFITFSSIGLLIYLKPFSVTEILQYRVADLWHGCERKLSCSLIYLRKITKNVIQDSWYPGRNLKHVPPNNKQTCDDFLWCLIKKTRTLYLLT
jgi:hypothetical protein